MVILLVLRASFIRNVDLVKAALRAASIQTPALQIATIVSLDATALKDTMRYDTVLYFLNSV